VNDATGAHHSFGNASKVIKPTLALAARDSNSWLNGKVASVVGTFRSGNRFGSADSGFCLGSENGASS
jgi:hypothetical protein